MRVNAVVSPKKPNPRIQIQTNQKEPTRIWGSQSSSKLAALNSAALNQRLLSNSPPTSILAGMHLGGAPYLEFRVAQQKLSARYSPTFE